MSETHSNQPRCICTWRLAHTGEGKDLALVAADPQCVFCQRLRDLRDMDCRAMMLHLAREEHARIVAELTKGRSKGLGIVRRETEAARLVGGVARRSAEFGAGTLTHRPFEALGRRE